MNCEQMWQKIKDLAQQNSIPTDDLITFVKFALAHISNTLNDVNEIFIKTYDKSLNELRYDMQVWDDERYQEKKKYGKSL
jgi:hypothetical protein